MVATRRLILEGLYLGSELLRLLGQRRRPEAQVDNLLRPGGTFLCTDIAASSNLEENMEHPLAPTFYGISTMHCMTVSLALGGEGLGNMWGTQKTLEYFKNAGFSDVRAGAAANTLKLTGTSTAAPLCGARRTVPV